MSNIHALDLNDRFMTANALSLPVESIPAVVFTSKKCFIGDTGFEGSIFTHGDCDFGKKWGRDSC